MSNEPRIRMNWNFHPNEIADGSEWNESYCRMDSFFYLRLKI